MKVAIPVCSESVATTMDFARELVVADCEASSTVRRSRIELEESLPGHRAKQLVRLRIDVLICGAISRLLAKLIVDSGIQIIPFVSGPVDSVLEAFLNNRLGQAVFLLPGCTVDDRERFVAVHAVHKSE